LQVLGQIVHHCAQGSVKLLAKLIIIIVGDLAAHLPNVIIAHSDGFKLRGIQVLPDNLLLRFGLIHLAALKLRKGILLD